MFLKKVFEKFTSTQDDNVDVDPAEEAFKSYNLRIYRYYSFNIW